MSEPNPRGTLCGTCAYVCPGITLGEVVACRHWSLRRPNEAQVIRESEPDSFPDPATIDWPRKPLPRRMRHRGR